MIRKLLCGRQAVVGDRAAAEALMLPTGSMFVYFYVLIDAAINTGPDLRPRRGRLAPAYSAVSA